MRLRHASLALCVTLPFAVLLSACGSGSGSSADPAKTLIDKVNGAVSGARSVTFVDVSGSTDAHGKSGVTTTIKGALSATKAQETLVNSTETGTIELVLLGSTVYFRGPATALENGLGLSAAQAAKYQGIWISVSQSDSVFQTLTGELTPGTELSSLVPSASTATIGAPTTVHHIRVVPISGPVHPGTGTKSSGTETLFVATSTHLPVGASQLAHSVNGTSSSRVVTFSGWNRPITVTPPAYAVTLDSIQGS